ncbi:MAG: trypsin [Syntrophus sp. (in: bacteria)]|nr:trypsin [Syntrophus sp. (in: bacteria)]
MKRVTKFLALFAMIFSVLIVPGLQAPAHTEPKISDESADKTLSPYFFVKSDDPAIDQLPLKATSAAVNISGVIADVVVTQVYKNEGKKAIEAIYIFPASTRAAVYGMKMVIGKRVIEAKIKKRDEARKEYEQARAQGKSASLLEQQRPNVFQMNVANIMPNDEIKVELKYTELLLPADQVYEFSYPTVVGPRYSNSKEATASASEKWVKNPYLRQNEKPTYSFDITVNLAAGMPIKELASTSHKVNATYMSPSTARVTLDKSDAGGGNRDYILHYRLAGDIIQSGLLLFEGEKENFFLLMMQPPKKITNARIPGREYIFIVDVSGSMYGFPLEISKKLLRNLIGSLRPSDKFNVLLFSGGSSLMSEESLPANTENIDKAMNVIDRQKGGGGTELLPALKRALSLKRAEGFSRSVIIATDGYVSVEEEAFDFIRSHLADANVFAFGIGSSVNRHIIEGMAHVGMGEPFVITKPDEAPAQAERFRKMIQSPVLTNVKVKFNGLSTYDVEPISIPDVLAERPVIVFGKWRGKPQGTITLTGISGDGKYAETVNVSTTQPQKTNASLKYLWARQRITILSDYNKLRSDDKRVKEVTQLGLTYNLLTAYTSFVAIDNEIRNKDGKTDTVNQPLPLPQDVSDYAIGQASGMTMALAAPSPTMYRQGNLQYDTALKAKTESSGVVGGWVAEKKKTTAVTIGEITATGGLSKETLRGIIEKNMEKIETCYTGIASGGKLVLALTINPDGTIKIIKTTSDTVKNITVTQCVMDAFKKLLFPAVADTSGTTATITLVFQ